MNYISKYKGILENLIIFWCVPNNSKLVLLPDLKLYGYFHIYNIIKTKAFYSNYLKIFEIKKT